MRMAAMWVSRDSGMLKAEQRERKLHMVSVANKWLVVNLLAELCIIIELKVLPFFQLFGIPKRFLPFYWKFGIALLVVSAISAFYHLCTICRALIYLNLRDSKRRKFYKLLLITGLVLSTAPSPNVSPGRKLYGPTMFSNLAPSFESSHSKGGFFSHSVSGACDYLKSNSASPSRGDPSPGSWNTSNAVLCSPLWDKTTTHSSSSTSNTIGSVSLLNIALSPIAGPPLFPDSCQASGLDNPVSSITSNSIRSNTWSSPLWTSAQSPSYQYQLSCTPPASPKRGMLDDQPSFRSSILSTSICSHKHSQSDVGFGDSRYCRQYNKEQPTERAAEEYWEEHQVTGACLEQYTMDLRKWLHGTIFRRLVDEITAVNRHLRETYGEETVIGCRFAVVIRLFLFFEWIERN
ncbi:Transmembrane protein [Paragonimus heterotremus]|uniref:Transmembrane protein n=1 Tax=Paragonimus heterotremus TaxID=100268 RepID=A0A8J4SYR5_9TREM|nr:Transmembrane protein [Paragonimus heterotremus]